MISEEEIQKQINFNLQMERERIKQLMIQMGLTLKNKRLLKAKKKSHQTIAISELMRFIENVCWYIDDPNYKRRIKNAK